jgi:LacI family repressor for deo operon, udp, cdd, tsx, nupC, and nupG
MREIADAAGVSVATVSRALKGDPVVNAETRARVVETAARLAYRVNPVARSLRTQRTHLVLAVVPDIGNPFYSYVLAGIEDEAQRNGYSVLIGNVAGNDSRLRTYGDQVLSGRADGMILLTGRLPLDGWLAEAAAPAPVIALCDPIPGLPFVGIDDRLAAFEMVSHLIARGCRRIAHIRGPETSAAYCARAAGCLAALAKAGQATAPALGAKGDTTIDSGYRAATELMARSPDIDGIFAANDEMAIGAVNALRELGLDVPGRVRVAGCDGLEFGARYHPPLSTVEHPRSDLGATAMRHLVDLMEGKAVPPVTLLPHQVICRMTTAG